MRPLKKIIKYLLNKRFRLALVLLKSFENTLRETNMALKKSTVGRWILGRPIFRGELLVSGRVIYDISPINRKFLQDWIDFIGRWAHFLAPWVMLPATTSLWATGICRDSATPRKVETSEQQKMKTCWFKKKVPAKFNLYYKSLQGFYLGISWKFWGALGFQCGNLW